MKNIMHLAFSLIAMMAIIQPHDARANTNNDPPHFPLQSGGDVIASINSYRQQSGLAVLSQNTLLSSLAQGQSDYQASINTVTHTGPGGTTPQDRATAAGYGGGNFFYLSEIIYGGNNRTTQDAMTWWKNSSLHNSIMLSSNYTEIGAGVATNGERVFYTAVLGGPTGDSSSSNGDGESGGIGSGSPSQSTQTGPIIMPIQKATPQADGAILHTVQEGQTLWTIAAVYEIELSTLYELNGLNQFSFVFPGDEIIVRSPGTYDDMAATDVETIEDEPAGETSTPEAQFTEVLGTPFSSLNPRPQNLPASTQTPAAVVLIPTSAQPAQEPLFSDPLVRYLIIGAFVVLMFVLAGSMFIQPPEQKAPSKDTDS